MAGERRFPIQGETRHREDRTLEHVPPSSVPWSEAEHAYTTYSMIYGTMQSLERLAERGGFGIEEFRVWRSGKDFNGQVIWDAPPLPTEDETADE